MKRILITGINGFVGGHYLQYLEKLSEEVDVLGIGRQPHCVHPTNIPFQYRQLDLQHNTYFADILNEFKPTHLVHLASQSSVGKSWKEPRQTYENNTLIFLNILDQVRLTTIPCRILSIGSGEEYGYVAESSLPLQEEMPVRPNNPYAVARVSQEMLAQVYVQGYNIDIVLTRSFNHMGPGQTDQFVVSSFAKKILLAKAAESKSTVIQTGNISIVRDFLDVRDVVSAYHTLLIEGKSGEIYNVCSGKGIALKEILDRLCELAGVNAAYEEDASLIRHIDNQIIVGSNKKIIAQTSWKPNYSLDMTLTEILEWWQEQLSQLN